MCLLPFSTCSLGFNHLVLLLLLELGRLVLALGQLCLLISLLGILFPQRPACFATLPHPGLYWNATFIVTPFLRLHPSTYSSSWLHFSSWPSSPSNILCRSSITSQSICKVHHCLVALKKVLNFKAQLNSTFLCTASYWVFLKIRQKEVPLNQIKI